MTNVLTRRRDERGIALIITMFLMASLSALAVSLMFLSNTETAATRNYRTMSQARYGGEAAVHAAMNYLMSANYTLPASPFTGYGTGKSPVTCTAGCTNTAPTSTCDASTVATAVSTGCIVLSGIPGISSNYPDATIAAAFSAAAQGTLATNASGVTSNAALGTVGYGAAAILLSMQQVTIYGGGTGIVLTWQVVGDGTVTNGTQPATVEVTATLEHGLIDAQTYAVFATGSGCGSITLQGNVATASYDSSSGTTVSNSGGDIGTNGNLSIGGSVNIHGSLSTPKTGVGNCTSGNVTALTESGNATVDNNDIVSLPQPLTFAAPPLPSPLPPMTSQTTCAQMAVVLPATCTTSGGQIIIDPMGTTVALGNISGNIVLKGGNYNINSIGSGNLTVGTSLLGTSSVAVNLAGKTSTGDLATPFNLNGNAVVNSSMDPTKFQLLYAGTGTIYMTGASNSAFMVYAPNAAVQTQGNADIYGSILAASVASNGTPRFIYDRHLEHTVFTMGDYVMSSFSWKKY